MTKKTKVTKLILNSTDGVIGVDEVGRGPIAGPVTVCAVYLSSPNLLKSALFKNKIRDSKKVSKAFRNKVYLTIRKRRALTRDLDYSVFSVSSKYIDKHGINKAITFCLDRCLLDLKRKRLEIDKFDINMDAGLKSNIKNLNQRSFIKGDEKFVEIAIASIVAKVTRDNYMKKLSRIYINYFWDKNVGYGTKEHIRAIKTHGTTKFHRKSYLKRLLSI